jgi:hypothetical protein
MRHRLLVLISLLAAAPSLGQEAGGNVTVARDLLAVLSLRGKACEAIASHEKIGESNYQVACTDGPRYRSYIADEDRVEIEELGTR